MSTDGLHTSPADSAVRVLVVTAFVAGLVAEVVGMAGLALGIGLQLANLVMRNLSLSGSVPAWLPDVSTLALVGGAFIYCAATDRHVRFEGILRLVPHRRRWIVVAVTQLVSTVLMVVLTYEGARLVKTQSHFGGSYSTAFNFPFAWFYAIAPIAFGLTAIRTLSRVALELNPRTRGVLEGTHA